MKNKFFIYVFILSLFLGITFSVLLNSPIKGNENSFISREIANKINDEKLELKKNEKKIEDLKRELKKLQSQTNIDKNVLNEDEWILYNNYNLIYANKKIMGEGIVINISNAEFNKNNIAFDIDKSRILLNLVNFAKQNDAEMIAINNQIISQGSGIVLAGNHINVNNIPIETPFELKIIGNEKKLYRFFEKETSFLNRWEDKYGIIFDVKKSRNLEIVSAPIIRELEFIKNTN